MDDLKSDALRDMDVEIRLDATRRKPRFIIETAEMTPELTRLIQQLTARAAVPIIGYQQDKAFPLQQDSCLSKIFFGTVGVGSHNVHTDLRAGVATKHRAILYDGCSGSFSGSCYCRTDTGQAASHYYNFIFSGFTVN